LIRERSLEGREKAKARGVVFGARPKLTSQEICDLLNDYETPGWSKREIAEHYYPGVVLSFCSPVHVWSETHLYLTI